VRLDQSAVRRHARPGLEQHEVAGDQLAGRDLARRAVAHDLHRRRRHRLERRHRLLRAVLLPEPDPRVQHDHDEDHDRLGYVAQCRREHTGARQ
jgi:hypothetical protein